MSRDQTRPPPPRPPPRLRTIYLLGALATLMTFALALDAWRELARRPPPPAASTAGVPRWSEHVGGAIFWITVAVACVSYTRYRRRLARAGRPALPRPWHLRREVRRVLHVVAAVEIAALPLYGFKAVVVMTSTPAPASARAALDAFLPGGLVAPLIGAAVLWYDRRRATLEARRAGNLCLACGYDLRASPGRCPECGTEPPAR